MDVVKVAIAQTTADPIVKYLRLYLSAKLPANNEQSSETQRS
jgi:hypothetical protein